MFQRVVRRPAFRALEVPDAGPLPAAGEGPGRSADMARLVRDALAGHRVSLEFQPILMLGAVPRAARHEGFVRILDGAGNALPASRFVAAVEESRLGRELDCASLRLGLRALRDDASLRLAINASVRSLGNAAWRATLEEGVAELGARLTLEVGEGSATLLADRLARFMRELRPRGLSFVLDDFGVGPLSLRQLRDFRFDGVKIHGSYVRGLDRSPNNQTLIAALISVAHRFGMSVVAKDVETEGEAAQVRALGVDGLQGFLFGRPGPFS